jgi:hypothetical protein
MTLTTLPRPVPAGTPQAMLLHYLRTLTSIGGDQSSTIVMPLPAEFYLYLVKQAPAPEKA